jgi:hypothetical protein
MTSFFYCREITPNFFLRCSNGSLGRGLVTNFLSQEMIIDGYMFGVCMHDQILGDVDGVVHTYHTERGV